MAAWWSAFVVMSAVFLVPHAAGTPDAGSADAASYTLYAHYVQTGSFVLLPQAPPKDAVLEETRGLATHTVTCVDTVLGPNPVTSLTSVPWHTWYGHFSPTGVHYREPEEKPRVFPERGIVTDLVFGEAPTLYWQLLVRVATKADGTLPAHVPLPSVSLQATLRASDAISVGDEAYNQGALLATGKAGPATLAGPLTSVPPVGGVAYTFLPGHGHLYTFAVPLHLETDTVPRENGANLRIDAYVENPACPDPSVGAVMPNAVLAFSHPDHRAHLAATIVRPLEVVTLHPQWVAEDLVLHAAITSVFGQPDIQGFTAHLRGPQGVVVPMEAVAIGSPVVYHDSARRPLEIAFLAKGAASLPGGAYQAVFSATNLQETARVEQAVAVDLEVEQPASGWPAALGLSILGALAVAMRRRER